MVDALIFRIEVGECWMVGGRGGGLGKRGGMRRKRLYAESKNCALLKDASWIIS